MARLKEDKPAVAARFAHLLLDVAALLLGVVDGVLDDGGVLRHVGGGLDERGVRRRILRCERGDAYGHHPAAPVSPEAHPAR